MIRRIVLLSLLIATSLLGFSQEKHFGVSYGNGRLGSGRLSNRFLDAYFNSLEFRYQRENKEKKYRLNFLGGFEGIASSSHGELVHFKTGIGADVIAGGKLFPFFGLGLNLKLLLISPGDAYKVASLGAYLNTGLGYRISSSFYIDVLCQFQFGITPLYISHQQSSGELILGHLLVR